MPEAALGVAEADAAAPPPPKKRPPPKRAKATDEAVAARTAAEPVEAESPAVKTKRQPPPKKPKAEGMLGSESATVESASSAELASATVESFESTTLEETLPLLPKKKPPPRRSQS
jgi:hypothetical protein